MCDTGLGLDSDRIRYRLGAEWFQTVGWEGSGENLLPPSSPREAQSVIFIFCFCDMDRLLNLPSDCPFCWWFL